MPIIRTAQPQDSEAIADVMIDSIRDVFHGLVPEQCLNWITREESASNWRQTIVEHTGRAATSFRVVVDAHGTIAGYVFAGLQDDSTYPVEIHGLSVRPEAQGQGLGRVLLRQCARDLLDAGASKVRVTCLQVNPSCRFWERMGARMTGEKPYDWNGIAMRAVVYVWDDISVILREDITE